MSPHHRLARQAVIAACWGLGTVLCSASASSAEANRHWREATQDDYRKHLQSLQALTQTCAQGRDLKSCDPTTIGLDDKVPTADGNESRLVRYGWLRVLFSKAEEPDQAQSAPDSRRPSLPAKEITRPAAPSTTQLLVEAEARLKRDLNATEVAQTKAPKYDRQRSILGEVLAGSEFRSLHPASESDLALEKIGNWLNHVFENVAKMRARSPWIGRALVWGFLLVVGTGLGWGLMRLERRWRVKLIAIQERPAAEAASARDWQLWLADAREASENGEWREAIHFVYWAAISRMESRRMWPADRARTPREYLGLVAADDPRKTGLASLTGSFERTWYGGRAASEADYRRAELLADGVIAGRAAVDGAGSAR